MNDSFPQFLESRLVVDANQTYVEVTQMRMDDG